MIGRRVLKFTYQKFNRYGQAPDYISVSGILFVVIVASYFLAYKFIMLIIPDSVRGMRYLSGSLAFGLGFFDLYATAYIEAKHYKWKQADAADMIFYGGTLGLIHLFVISAICVLVGLVGLGEFIGYLMEVTGYNN